MRKTVNVILIMLITIMTVFEKSSYKEMSEISCDEYPVRRREAKKKNLREKNFPT